MDVTIIRSFSKSYFHVSYSRCMPAALARHILSTFYEIKAEDLPPFGKKNAEDFYGRKK